MGRPEEESRAGQVGLVARGFQQPDEGEDTFAPTASAWVPRFILAVEENHRRSGAPLESRCIAVADVSTAFLHAPRADEALFVRPPAEAVEWARARGDLKEGDTRRLWRVHRALYGLRTSPRDWYRHFCEVLKAQGWAVSAREGCLFSREGVLLSIHVDDLFVAGDVDKVTLFLRELSAEVSLKFEILRGDQDGAVDYLGRRILQENGSFRIGLSSSYTDRLLEMHSMVECKTMGWVSEVTSCEDGEVQLGKEEHALFRSSVGVLMWLCQERADVAVAVNRLSTNVQSPTVRDLKNLRKLLRYLKFSKDWLSHVWCDDLPLRTLEGKQQWRIDGFSDSDWAGEKSRLSRSGYAVYLGSCLITFGTRRQRVISLSSCEAEFYACTVCCQEVLAVSELVIEVLGVSPSVTVYLDSNSARALAGKQGVGRTKHVETRALWVQQQVADGRLRTARVGTQDNPSDILTKITAPGVQKRLRGLFGFTV